MEIETLKKSHLKRNIIIGIVIVAIISAIILTFTRAKYRTTQSIPLVNGTINYSLADLNVVALYINGEEATKLDNTKQYTLDTSKSTCTYKDGSKISNLALNYDSKTGGLSISPFTTKGTKCTLYFNESKGRTMLDIITNDYSQSTRSNFGSAYTTSHTKQVFTTTDWEGTSYYFAGAPTDNWVYFGGFYWRIIRVNGDGSTRLLYNGTTTGATGSGTLTKTSQQFNSSYNRSEYVGLKYTSGQQHGQNSNSTILTELNSWYTSSNLDDHASHIDTNIGFCSDRNMASGYSWSSQPSSNIYYAARERIATNQNPSLACSSNDIVKVPVGLLTADEAMFGGVSWSGNATGNYLINGQNYWTMSPYNFNATNSYASVFYVNSNGSLSSNGVRNSRGVRPVINLKADTKFEGSGTSSDPFTVVE